LIAWHNQLIDPIRLGATLTFLSAPSTSRIRKHDHAQLSPLFWRAVSIKPSEKRTAIANFSRLLDELVDEAQDAFLGDVARERG
jgi:hypothetical protein